jgi:hypothetical protein
MSEYYKVTFDNGDSVVTVAQDADHAKATGTQLYLSEKIWDGALYGKTYDSIVSSERFDYTPEVGMGVSQFMFSDVNPYTIIEVKTPKKIVVQADDYKRINSTEENFFSEPQEYEYTPNPNGVTCVLTLRPNGHWHQEGQSMKSDRWWLGLRMRHYDFSR